MKSALKKIFSFAVLGILIASAGHEAKLSQADSLTTVSATLSNSRPSVSARLSGAHTVGSSIVTIQGSAAPTITTDQLASGDTVLIGDGATASPYDVTTITSSTVFNLDAALATGDVENGDVVIASQSGTLSVGFVTANAVPTGKFRVLVPALATNAQSIDGLPDADAWDFTGDATDIDCPTTVGNYTFGTAVFTASITFNGADYHSFVCPYTGSGDVGRDFTADPIIIGDALTDVLINPIKTAATGTADSRKIIVQNLTSADVVIDSTVVAVGVIEAVRVTAEVPPQITFTIAGVASSTSTCGITTTETTTANTVPLGELSIGAFTYAAQTLTVSTNAVEGYSVTARADNQLRTLGTACAGTAASEANGGCILDVLGDGSNITPSASGNWDLTATKGFGYTLHNSDAGTIAFQYNTATGNCDGTNCFRQFADAEASESPVVLFSNSTVADSQNANVCYAAVVSATQAANQYYQNTITYTATATF